MPARAAPAPRTPAATAAGDLVKGQLSRTSRAFARLARDGAGVSELHAARVHLRRLRALVRAFRRVLGRAAGRRVRRDLRDIARITGGTRDLDVFLAWLGDQPRSAERTAWAAAARRERSRRLASEIAAAVDAWPAVRKRLRRRLRDVPPASSSFGTVAARALREASRAVDAAVTRAVCRGEADALHRARIRAKRLRYLLEVVAPRSPEAQRAAAWAAALQDAVGDVRDAELVGERLRRGRLPAETLQVANARRLREARQQLARRLGDDAARAEARAAVRHVARALKAAG